MKHRILSFFLLFCFALNIYKNDFTEKVITVVFRYDDYSTLSNQEIDRKIIDLFYGQKIPLTIGVIPFAIQDPYDPSPQIQFPLSTDKVELLNAAMDEGIVDIALHGFSHQTHHVEVTSEFSGLPYQRQRELISAGESYLEDVLDTDVTIFVPPWNSYDNNTIEALQNLGFSAVSANKDGYVEEISILNFLPATCTLDVVREGVLAARRSSVTDPIMVVLFHSYDFKEVDTNRGIISFLELEELLTWLSLKDDVRILSIDQATLNITGLNADRFKSAQNRTPVEILVESTLQEEEVNDILYRGGQISIFAWIKVIGFYLLISVLLGFFAFFFAKYLLRSRKKLMKILTYAAMIMTTFLSIYILSDEYVYWLGMSFMMGSIGISMGFLINYFLLIRKRTSKIINQSTSINLDV